jgi:tetratricopeptide (TPR) repeat protein
MSDSDQASKLAEVAAAFRALRRGITRGRGFSLYLCACNAPPARDKLIEQLAVSLPESMVHRHEPIAGEDDLLETVAGLLADGDPGPVMIVGLEQVLAEPDWAERFLSALNLRRSEWPARVPYPVAFWLPGHLLGRLTSGAPDFFDWRSDTLEFPEISIGQTRVFATRDFFFGVDPRFSKQEQDERVAELRARLAATPNSEDEQVCRTRLQWWDELADLMRTRGEVDEALRIRTEEELPVYQRLGDVRDMAVTQGKIADILMARGQLDEALRIRTEEQFPVFQRLGAVREMAVTQGRIADILMDRGQLDEALRIRTEEELPVFQRLGAVREMAVTQGKIADILMDRGQLDEALRILTDEVLSAFEQLGDVREMAVTQGQIADILMDRGQLDEALRIRTEEELPVYQRLGAVREMAVTPGDIAVILMARVQLEEALRIRTEEQLPVFQRLGDVRDLLICRANIAVALLMRMNQTKDQTDRTQANQLLCVALADARRLRLPEADQIEQILQQAGMDCSGTDALP